MTRKTSGGDFLPADQGGDLVLMFKPDNTVVFPGIQSYDVPCIWRVRNQELEIRLDSSRLTKLLFARSDDVRITGIWKHPKKVAHPYKSGADSIANSKDIADVKRAAEVYTGVYQINNIKPGRVLELTSPTTEFYLLSGVTIPAGALHLTDSGE